MDYLSINKKSWNNRTDAHYDSDFYDVEAFVGGTSSLNEIELKLLGNLEGKKILHLQCHFGQDSISLARMGAEVVGVDLSDQSIEKAQELNARPKSNCRFICSDVYSLPTVLEEKFDIVFTSYGTVVWLPDSVKWANIISHFLKPKGKFVFVEFHPVLWMYDDDFKELQYRYFNSEPIHELEEGTYAEKDAKIQQEFVMWNHGIGEIISALLSENLQINHLEEYDYSPYDCTNVMEKVGDRMFRIKGFGNKVPLTYSVVATKTIR